MLPGEELKKTIISIDTIPCSVNLEGVELLFDGCGKENINEILENVSLLEDSVLCI